MKDMVEAIAAVPGGGILLWVMGLLFMALLWFLVWKLTNKKTVKLPWVEIQEHEKNGNTETIKLKLDKTKTIQVVITSLEDNYKAFEKSKNETVRLVKEEHLRHRERCVRDAIGILFNSYLNEDKDEEDKHENIFKYFLQVEIGLKLKEELSSLIKKEDLDVMSDDEKNSEVVRITQALFMEANNSILKIDLINRSTFKKIFEENKEMIKDSISNAIKNFIKMSKREKEELLKANEARLKEAETRLRTFLEM